MSKNKRLFSLIWWNGFVIKRKYKGWKLCNYTKNSKDAQKIKAKAWIFVRVVIQWKYENVYENFRKERLRHTYGFDERDCEKV